MEAGGPEEAWGGGSGSREGPTVLRRQAEMGGKVRLGGSRGTQCKGAPLPIQEDTCDTERPHLSQQLSHREEVVMLCFCLEVRVCVHPPMDNAVSAQCQCHFSRWFLNDTSLAKGRNRELKQK